MRKEVVFSAKDTGVASTMQKMRAEAEMMGRALIEDARKYTTSGKESIRFIEDQIKAIERRNNLQRQGAKLNLEEQREAGSRSKDFSTRAGAEDQYKKGMSSLGKDQRVDEMQLALLREMIETIKTTAREEIAEDRKDVTRQINADRQIGELGAGADPITALKHSIQREELGRLDSQEKDEESKFKNIGRRTEQASNAVAGGLSSKNEMYALAGVMAAIPFVGAGISMLSEKMLQGAEHRQEARAVAGGRRGQSTGLIAGNAYGMTNAEATLQYGNAQDSGSARALGMMGILNQGTMGVVGSTGATEAMKLHQGMGIDPGVLNQLGGYLGYAQGRYQSSEDGDRKSAGGRMFDMLTKSFADTGLLGDKGQQTVNMPTIMSQTAQVLGTLTNTLDSIDPRHIAASMAGLTGLGGSFADPEKLAERYGQLHQGLTDQSNPFAQAIKFSTMQGMPGGAGKSRFELMEMQERGMSEPGYMKEYMTKLHQMSGGNKDMFMEEVKAAFPQMSFSNTRKLVEGFLKDPNMLDANFQELTAGKSALADRNFTGEMQVSTAEWSETFADWGEELVGAMGFLTDSIKDLMKYIK